MGLIVNREKNSADKLLAKYLGEEILSTGPDKPEGDKKKEDAEDIESVENVGNNGVNAIDKEKLEIGKPVILISNSEVETKKIAKELLDVVPENATVILSGNLGVGKTKFTEGVLEKYNMEDQISSPTFTIINEYENEERKIYHFDVYRLQDSVEFYDIGGDEYLGKALSIIEWGEIIEDIINVPYYKVEIEKIYKAEDEKEDNIQNEKRKIIITKKNI